MVISAGVVLFLPGAAYLAWFNRPGRGFAAAFSSAAGISISLTALAALATFVFHFRLYGWEIGVIYSVLAILTGLGWYVSWRRKQLVFTKRLGIEIALTVGIGALLAAWRLYQASSLAFPAWVDSVHHALITRVLLEDGRLPADLSPYLNVPFYYHYGFHSLAAVFTAVSRMPVDQAMLIIGQVLSAAVCFSVYRLGMVIWNDPRRSLAAALLAGFFSHMPAYYVTWGRYTLLAGLIVLPLAIAEAIEILHPSGEALSGRWKQWLSMAILTAGVLLTHYLAALLLAAFLILVGLTLLYQDIRSRHISYQRWGPLLGGALLGFILSLPWLVRVFQYSGIALAIDVVLPKEIGGNGFSTEYASYLWYLAGPQRNYWFLLLGGVGLLLGFWQRRCRQFAVWAGLLAIGSLPIGFKLPPFRQDHLVIIVFLPAAIFAGHLIFSIGEALEGSLSRLLRRYANREAVQLIDVQDPGGDPITTHTEWAPIFPEAVQRRVSGFGPGLAAAVVIGLCVWGAVETRDILNPATILATPADHQALVWIQEHVPPGARFFINVTPWQGGIYRGVDGGWWILPMTGRWSLLPPVVYAWGTPDYIKSINDLAAKASSLKTCSSGFWEIVRQAELTHVYLRQGVGSLQPGNLTGCQGISLVYQQNGVSIYTLQSRQ